MVRRYSNQRLYPILAVTLILVMAYQVGFSISWIEYRAAAANSIEEPFNLKQGTNEFSAVDEGLKQAGIGAGDRLLAVDGEPYRGLSRLARVLQSRHTGDRLEITVQRKDASSSETVSAQLRNSRMDELTPFAWTVVSMMFVFIPLFCLLLGFGVLAVRPRDPLAWLLLALMVSFSLLSSTAASRWNVMWLWPDFLRPAAIFYRSLFENVWAIWMLLFGIYFPQRLSLDQRRPWLKWILIAPIVLYGIGESLTVAGDVEDYRIFAALWKAIRPLRYVQTYLSMASISGFFVAIYMKVSRASSTDARRRLILLANGTSVALTPLFLLALNQLFGGNWGNNDLIWIPCLLMLGVFPLTLAYVIVVQRALDVRVVVRQGLRYALATRGIRVLQIVLVAVVTLAGITLLNDPARRRPQRITVIGVCLVAGLGIRRGADQLRAWTDRRFFREAYKTEQILSELSDTVRTMVETGPLLKTVADKISESLHVGRIAMLVRNNGSYQPAYAVGYSDPPGSQFEEKAGTVQQLKRNREPLRIYFDDPDCWIYRDESVTDAERRQLETLGAELILPLAFKEKLAGFISLSAKRSEEPYSKTDVQLLESVAMQTGLALENSHLTEAIATEVAQRERLNRELEIAREVQERLFPQIYPNIPGVDLAGRCRPALGVGGDYYDFLELPDGCLGIGVGDVSGKGIPAALLMASLQASLRGQTIAGSPDLARLMSNVNLLIFNTTPANRYATFFYAQYEPGSHRLSYVNGGHNPPMIFRNGSVIRLEEGGPVIGMFQASRYLQTGLTLESGDVLVLFTDGISEAMNDADEEWGEERLMAAVERCREQPATKMIECLMQDADQFVAGAPQHDDMTIMVLKVV